MNTVRSSICSSGWGSGLTIRPGSKQPRVHDGLLLRPLHLALFDLLEHAGQIVSQINGYDGRGGFMGSQAIIIALILGGCVGIINGVIIAYAKMPAFIVTLSMSGVIQGIAYIITKRA